MKSLITSTLFIFFISIGLGLKAEEQRLFDAVPERVQFQNKLIEDVSTMNTDTSVDIKFSQNFRTTEIIKSNKKVHENLQTIAIESSNYNNPKPIVQPVKLATPLLQEMDKQVYVSSYKVDYKGGTRHFPSSVEGEAFMRQLNNDYQKNIIPNPGNVNGYYTITLVQGLVDYGRWNTKALQIN